MYPYGFKVTTEPANEPVSVNDLADELRLDDDQNIPALATIVTAARIAVERYIRRALITQTITAVWDSWCDVFTLERPPLGAITSFQYLNQSLVWTDVTSSLYGTDSTTDPARVYRVDGQTWPTDKQGDPASIKIIYTAGYGATKETVPMALRQAIIALAIDLYEHPESQPEIALKTNRTVEMILAGYKMPLVK